MTGAGRAGPPRPGPALRRLALGAALLAAAMTATGCTQLLSINEDALVVGMGLDAGPGRGQVTTTLQWPHHGPPGGSSGGGALGGGGGGGGGGGSQLLTLGATAPDVAAAVSRVRAETDQRVTFFVTDLVVLGQDLARRGAAEPLDYLWRSGDFPETADVVVARGSAAGLLASPFPGGISVELARRLARAQFTDLGSIPIPIWRFLARTTAAGEAAWAPVFAPTAAGFRAAGTALFAGDRMTGLVSQEETGALGWLLKSGGFGDLVLPGVTGPDGEPVALRVRARTLRAAAVDATRARLRLDLLAEVSLGWRLLLQSRSPAALEAEAARQATRDVRAVLDRLQAAGSDVLGLGEVLRERDPAAVRDWPRSFRRMRIALQVRVRIVTGGRGA
jgi:hypothetical protein